MTPRVQRYPGGSGSPHSVSVAIVGGGIGGMALALSLHNAGFRDVDVYESASRVKELGVGINVLPHATRELTELGLLDELAAAGIPTAELAYYSKHGQRIWSEPRGLAAGYRWPQYSIHRGPLLGVLHRAVLDASAPSACTPAIICRTLARRRTACGPNSWTAPAVCSDRTSRPRCWSAATVSTP